MCSRKTMMFWVPGARISTNIAAFAVSELTVDGMRGNNRLGGGPSAPDAGQRSVYGPGGSEIPVTTQGVYSGSKGPTDLLSGN